MPSLQAEPSPLSSLLRRFRAARRMSQLEVALTCDISARHLSFLETGRASPSREMVIQLAEGLCLPLSERNALLQAAGFAAIYPASPLSSEALAPFRDILSEMMERHAPYPALLCDRHWTLIDANPTARLMLNALKDDPGEANVIRIFTESRAAESAIVNYAEMLGEMLGRIRLEALGAAGDPVLEGLLERLQEASARHPVTGGSRPRSPLVPLIMRTPSGELRFLSTVAQFGTSEDVTVRDLRLELLFPADETTRAAMISLAASLPGKAPFP
jgi:transcriptional regulator with XRE-family HTH domain